MRSGQVRSGVVLAWGAAMVAVLALGGCEPKGPGAVDGARLAAADANNDWPAAGKGYAEQRFSPLDKVNTGNVAQLGLAWSAEFDTDRGQEATPVEVDGVLFTTTAWSKVYAFDAATGKALWSYDPKVEGSKGFDACCDVVNRGVAVWKGRVYVGTLDGRLIALDAKTGAVDWSAQTTDNSKPYTITGVPRIIKDKVLIGNGGAEYGVRGYVSAYDATTGKMAWRFYTAPNPTGAADGAASDKIMKEKAAATWSDGYWKQSGGGATVWDSMAYDPKLDIVYLGVGNGSPWNHMKRSGGKGDNLFVSSILALKPDTGEYVWHYQTTPGESWDYTATQSLILADLQVGGKPRQVIMQAPKNGFFYVLDRATGELLSAKNFVPINWATSVDLKTGRPVENPAARYANAPSLQMPAPFGGHNWHPMAFNPKTGLVYIPAQSVPFAYADAKDFKYRQGAWNTGTDFLANTGPQTPAQTAALIAQIKGMLIAWDPIANKAVWTVQHPYFWNAGVLTTGGGLVFQGAAEGDLSAYDASTGAKLWTYKTTNGVIAAPMTYELNGEQYVAVMVGEGGAGQLSSPALMPQRPRLPGRLMVFKIGGTAKAPDYVIPPQPTIDLTQVASTGSVTNGYAVFNENCQVCHGANAVGQWLPKLTASPMITNTADFRSVVVDGARAHNGMASFKRFLSDGEVEDIRAFLIATAKGQPTPAVAPAK